jgi:hypothetical protein
MALFSLPLDRFVACLTSLLSLGLLTMPLTGPLIDPLTAALMLSGSISTVLGVELAGDQDWRFFLFCSLCVLFWEESFGDCITDRRNRLADSRETARLNMELRFGEALRYVGGSGVGAAYNALMRMRPAGVRRGLVLVPVPVMVGLGCRIYGLDCGCGILQRLPWWMMRQLECSGR